VYNPVRFNQPYRNNNKRRARQLDPKAGIKHSDIMRRQGLGQTIPLMGRISTPYGVSAEIFAGEDFTVRSEFINSGNNLGYGVNKKAERVYQVAKGVLYVTYDNNGARNIIQIQEGGTFRAPKGLAHSVSSSNSDVELIVIESSGYMKDWKVLMDEEVVTSTVPSLLATTPDVPATPRRKDQSKAKAAAEQQARKRARSTSPNVAASGKIGVNKIRSSNSANVVGVNPRPGGPGAYSDE